MDGYAQPEGALESLGVPPDMAGKIRRRGVLPALLNMRPEDAGSELAGGSERQPRLVQAMNQGGSGQPDPGMAAPESTYSANGQTRLVDHVQEHRIEDDTSRSPYGDAEAMTPVAQATSDRPVRNVSELSPSGRPPLREAMNAAIPPPPDMNGLRLRDAVMDSPLSRPSVRPPTPLTEAQANLAKAEQPSGVSRLMTKARGIHNPFLRGLGEVGAGLARGVDIAGSMFAPNAAAMIPGSTLNHAVRRFGAQRQLAQAEGPPPEHMDSDQGPIEFNRQTQQWEPITIGGNPVGSKSSLESTATGRRQLSDQYGLSGEDRIRYILTGQMPAAAQQPEHMDTDQGPIQFNRQTGQWEPITMGGQRVGPKAQPKPDTPEQQEIDYYTGKGMSLPEAVRQSATDKQPPQRDPVGGVGTWSLQQDKDGNPILFNSKTAQTKPAPGGMVPKGTGQITPATQKILQETSPVHDQVRQLLNAVEPYKDDNTPGTLVRSRLKYALGMADPKGDLGDQISKLELDRVMAGARVLKGSSRAYQALQLAMQHAPNTKIDSPQLMYNKLQTIEQNLTDIEDDAVKYGTKGQTAASAQGSLKTAGNDLKPPKEADPGMKWQHRTTNGKIEWRQAPQ